MKLKSFFGVLAGLILIGLGSYFKRDGTVPVPATQPMMMKMAAPAVETEPMFSIRGTQFTALVANTPALREQGLGGRDSLAADEAMVFVFERPDMVPFWMKDMKFSIDILFLDEDIHVISSARNVSPDTYPKLFFPDRPAMYVVEFSAGTLDRLHVQDGDSAKIDLSAQF